MSQPIVRPIVEFERFVDALQAAKPKHHVGLPHSRVSDEAEFKRLQAHLVKYHAGVEPVHSFLDSAGKVFDCIPVEQQVSLRGHRGRLPRAPGLPEADEARPAPIDPVGFPALQLGARFSDPLGNRMQAPRGTIPVQRLGLADAARFRSLAGFFERLESAKDAARVPAPSNDLHQWSTYEQLVDNIGGASTLSIWSPAVTGTSQLMSLGQVWFQAGSGPTTQTVEAGWQVDPGRYGHTRPVLFIYWTADNYGTTGCYNLTCTGFVQTNGAWMLGGAFPWWSTIGGAQVEIRISWLLDDGRWWLYLDGAPVGFYPVAIFNGGDMARRSSHIVFGGEVATLDNNDWPPMGSGALTTPTWEQVAYQRRIRYVAPNGRSLNADLQPVALLPFCYAATSVKYRPPWDETVWYGGPGGSLCS
jgi:hypothetical protein